MPIKYEYEVWSKLRNGPDQKIRTFMVRENAYKFAAELRKAHRKMTGKKGQSVVRVKRVSYRVGD